MKFTRARTPSPCNYTINSKRVVLSDDLSWKPHVLSVVTRSNRLLGLLKRTFGSHSKALFTSYRNNTAIHTFKRLLNRHLISIKCLQGTNETEYIMSLAARANEIQHRA